MIRDLRFKILYLFIGLLGYLFIAQVTIANSLSLSLDPSIIEIRSLPPSNTTSNITIQNKSDAQVNLRIYLKPFKANLENGELEYLNSEDSYLNNNVRILDEGTAIDGITLAPTQQKNLTLNVNVPQGEVGRDYYFSIIFISENSINPTSTSLLNRLGIASNVLLSIGEKETPDAVLEEFSSGFFYESGPVAFTVRIKNKGRQFIKPKGEISIKNMFGQNIGKVNLTSVNILSDSIRAIPNDLYIQELRSQDSLDSKPKLTLNFKDPKALWKENFLLGFYTATLNVTLSDEGPDFVKSINFFAFPFQGLIVILIIIIAGIIIANRVKARMSHINK